MKRTINRRRKSILNICSPETKQENILKEAHPKGEESTEIDIKDHQHLKEDV